MANDFMQYSKEVLEHFTNPHNQGVIENPDGVGMVGNPVCGDLMKIYLKIKKGKKSFPALNLKHWVAPVPLQHHL